MENGKEDLAQDTYDTQEAQIPSVPRQAAVTKLVASIGNVVRIGLKWFKSFERPVPKILPVDLSIETLPPTTDKFLVSDMYDRLVRRFAADTPDYLTPKDLDRRQAFAIERWCKNGADGFVIGSEEQIEALATLIRHTAIAQLSRKLDSTPTISEQLENDELIARFERIGLELVIDDIHVEEFELDDTNNTAVWISIGGNMCEEVAPEYVIPILGIRESTMTIIESAISDRRLDSKMLAEIFIRGYPTFENFIANITKHI